MFMHWFMPTSETLIRLIRNAGFSEPLLFACVFSTNFVELSCGEQDIVVTTSMCVCVCVAYACIRPDLSEP